MDLRNLNTFIQVAELNSFSRAAEKLGYSQPTVSFQIKQLEAELGVQLFDRVGHTISLTAAGRSALAHAQQIYRMTEQMTKGAKEDSCPHGLVRVAMADSLCEPLVLGSFAKFRAVYPHISLKITTAGTDELFRLLDHNEADIVCTLDSHIYNTTYIISHEEKIGAHFICPAGHPFARKDVVSLQDLMGEPFLLTEKDMSYRRLLDEQLARFSLEVTPVLEFGSADLICQLVSEGDGISFLPDYVTENAVRAGKISRLHVKEFDLELWKQFLYHRDKWIDAPMRAVLDFFSENTLTH